MNGSGRSELAHNKVPHRFFMDPEPSRMDGLFQFKVRNHSACPTLNGGLAQRQVQGGEPCRTNLMNAVATLFNETVKGGEPSMPYPREKF